MRRRIFLGLLPLLILLVVVGGYGIALFSHLGGAVDVILRENYRSTVAAQNMKESAERMDSALLFILAGEQERILSKIQRRFRISSRCFPFSRSRARSLITSAEW